MATGMPNLKASLVQTAADRSLTCFTAHQRSAAVVARRRELDESTPACAEFLKALVWASRSTGRAKRSTQKLIAGKMSKFWAAQIANDELAWKDQSRDLADALIAKYQPSGVSARCMASLIKTQIKAPMRTSFQKFCDSDCTEEDFVKNALSLLAKPGQPVNVSPTFQTLVRVMASALVSELALQLFPRTQFVGSDGVTLQTAFQEYNKHCGPEGYDVENDMTMMDVKQSSFTVPAPAKKAAAKK
jgi:hypothetical protein